MFAFPLIHVVAKPSKSKPRWHSAIKWLLFAAVLWYVLRYGAAQLQKLDLETIKFSPFWLFISLVVYFVGWLPAAVVFWRLVKTTVPAVPLYQAVRAHFCGHLGKYVPGKALSLVIRAAMLRPLQVPTRIAGLMATAETLLTMLTGLLVFIMFLPLALGTTVELPAETSLQWLNSFVQISLFWKWTLSLSILLAAILLTPVFARILNWLVKKLKSEDDAAESKLPLNSRLLWECGGMIMIGWILNGLALGCILVSIDVIPQRFSDIGLWITASSGAISLGFIVLFAPGGLGVREAILVGLLQLCPEIDVSVAVLAALLLRLVSFFSEVFFSALLYLWNNSTDTALETTPAVIPLKSS